MYTNHLVYLLGAQPGRPQSLRVIEPQPDHPQARRGTLCLLVELMGTSPIRNQVLRRMLDALQDVYYTAGGPQSDVLGGAVRKAHAILHEMNQRSPSTDLRAGVACAALLGDQITIASVGSTLIMIASDDHVDQFPPHSDQPPILMGGDEMPDIQIFRHQVRSHDVIFLGESDWVLVTSARVIAGALVGTTSENRFDVADYLRRQSGNAGILGLLIVLERQEDSHLISSTHRQTRKGRGLPTALGADPPMQNIATPEGPHVQTAPGTSETAPQSVPQRRTIAPQYDLKPQATTAERSSLLTSMASAVRHIGHQMHGWLLRILPDRVSGRSPSHRQERTWVDATAMATVAIGQPASPQSIPVDSPDFRADQRSTRPFVPPEPAQGKRARLLILLAILIPFLAFVVVAALYQQQGATFQAEANKLVDLAESKLVRARQVLDAGDQGSARTLLLEAQRHLSEAVDIIGFSERINQLSQQIALELQKVLQIRLLYSLDIPLAEFPRDASPHRIVVVDQDAYVLDIGRQVVEHYRLDPGRVTVQEPSGPILAEGDVVGATSIGRLKEISWQPRIPGFSDIASLLVLDHNNNVFRYNRVEGATVLGLAARDQLGLAAGFTVYNGRLYLADEQENQIFRYEPAGNGYNLPPEEWFLPQTQVNLAGLKRIAIDGDVWLLLANGTVLRFSRGQQTPFALNNSISSIEQPVDMAVGLESSSSIYIADAAQNRIVVFDKEGNYRFQLQAAEDTSLEGLRGLYIDEITGSLFLLTQTALYQQTLPE